MRRPLGRYGFVSESVDHGFERGPAGALDLRSQEIEVQNELHFVTFVSLAQQGTALSFRDAREDITTVVGLERGRYETLWSRIPVRGPVQLELSGAENQPPVISCTGFIEDQSGDNDRDLSPFRVGELADPFTLRPLVLEHGDGQGATEDDPLVPVAVTEVQEGVQNLSLYVYLPTAADSIDLSYKPDAEDEVIGTIHVKGGTKGFVRVLDRIPVRGPGRVGAVANIAAGRSGIVYGFFSS